MSASAPADPLFFGDQGRCDIRQVSGCGQVTGEGEAGREQESARTGGDLALSETASLPLWNNAASPLSSRSRISPSLPNLSPSSSSPLSLPQSCCLSGPVTHRPRSLFHTSPSNPDRQKQPRQMHSSIPPCPAWLISPTPRCHPLLQHSV